MTQKQTIARLEDFEVISVRRSWLWAMVSGEEEIAASGFLNLRTELHPKVANVAIVAFSGYMPLCSV
ncbi:hypothetical protein V6N13_110908 [Hibiscus sabdariffa]